MAHEPVASDELRESERRFATLVDTIQDYAIFMLSPEGVVLTWNKGAQRLKGYAPEEIIGRSFEQFYPEEARSAGRPARNLADARENGRVEDEGWRVRKDGSQFWADVIITALRDEGQQLVGYAKVTRDLTERRQAEQDRAARLAAERAARRVERLQAATVALASAESPAHAASILTDVAVRGVHASAGVVAIPKDDGTGLEVCDQRGYPPSVLPRGVPIPVSSPHLVAYAMKAGQALFIESREQAQSEFPELEPSLAASPFHSWAALPLVMDRQVIGVLGLSFDQPRALDPDGRSFLLALADVAAQALDRARLYIAERDARADAEAALRTQDEFLSVAAHELRTPVAAVKATAQLAQRAIGRGQFDAERMAAQLQSIARSSDRLGALIEDLLDVSRLRTGRLQLRRVHIDVGGIAQEIVARFSATETRHEFKLMAPRDHISVYADPLRLEQVLDNLLSNSVKYSPSGGTIQVRFGRSDGGVLFTVTDQGIGLPAGQEEHIFDAFGRGTNAAARQIQGLGLGLAICREIMDLHGGRIWATSPGEGRGVTMSVWLPITAEGPPDGEHT